jgi:DNA-binding transcriptional LysR family regulator
MTLEQLQCLRAIVEEGSFRAAASKLHKAQSAISYAIRLLEEEFGFELFDRSTYRPQLTEQGQIFYRKSLRVIDSSAELEQFGQSVGLNIEPRISISYSSLICFQNLLPQLNEFKNNFKMTQVELVKELLSGEQMILDDEVDFGIIESRAHKLDCIKLWDVEMPLVISAACPEIADCQITKESLLKLPQIVVRSTFKDDRDAKGVIEGANLWFTNSMEHKRDLIMQGVGWGSLPDHMVKADLKSKKLLEIKNIKSAREVVPIYLAKKKQRVMGPAASHLWDKLSK